jgi:hypothetical protein
MVNKAESGLLPQRGTDISLYPGQGDMWRPRARDVYLTPRTWPLARILLSLVYRVKNPDCGYGRN